MEFTERFAKAMSQFPLGERRCECEDPECTYNSHKVDLKRKFLSSICANDVKEYDKGFIQIQCYWSNWIVRSRDEQRIYDFHIEELLQKENIKDMNIKELREFYQRATKSIYTSAPFNL